MKHVVFVDSSATGLLAFQAAKKIGCYVTFIKPRDSSFVNISFKDDSKVKPYMKFVDQYVEIDDLSGERFHQTLEQIHAEHAIDALVTTSEAAITAVAREAERFGTLYPSHEALCNAVFKQRCRELLDKAGIRSPRFEVLSEQALLNEGPKKVPLPFVIKPTRGFGKQFSAICFTEDDVTAFTRTVLAERQLSDPMVEQLISHDYLVEEYVRGTLYSVEAIVQGGVVSCFATTIRFRSSHNEMLEMTSTMPSELGPQEKTEMVRYVQQVFTALGLDVGLYHVEVLRDAQGPCLVEINARMIGGVAPRLYQMLTDVDPFELLIRLHLGERLDIDDSRIKGGGTTVVVGARSAGKVNESFDREMLNTLLEKYGVRFSSLELAPGQEVGNFSGNLSLIGYVIILGDDSMSAAKRGYQFLRELEKLTGLDLAKFKEPQLHAES